jgi:hypothetical protein
MPTTYKTRVVDSLVDSNDMVQPTHEQQRPSPLSEMVIGSVDTLCGTEIDQRIPSTWNDKPPLLDKVGRNGIVVPETENLLKGMIRLGIPPALRCAIQLSNIMQRVHPHETPQYWYEYRTLSKVQVLDYAYDSLLQRILVTSSSNPSELLNDCSNNNSPNRSSGNAMTTDVDMMQKLVPTSEEYIAIWDSMKASSYGRSEARDVTKILPGTTSGNLATKRVLIAIEHCIGIDYAPFVPVLTAMLLTCMSESYAFTAIREMGHAMNSFYFPTTRIEHTATCYAFADILYKLHQQTASYLDDRGVLDIDGLAPIFQDFFIDVLPIEYVQRILDIYTFEGSKALFRFGVALLVLYKVESAEQLITISNADEWWHTMKLWAYSSRFNFEFVVRKAYGVHGRTIGLRRPMRFPRRSIIQRIIRIEQDRITTNEQLNDDGVYQEPPARPLGLVRPQPMPPDEYGNPGEAVKAILVQSVQHRQHIAQWLPLTLRLTDLNLIYSTNYHGRTLERFYEHVKYTKHTLVICEVLLPNTSEECIIGLYASQNWRISTQVYGDGGCFLFRLQPNAKCWKWQPNPPVDYASNQQQRTRTRLESVDLDGDDNENNNKTALLEQFMVGTKDYISMGGNPDGTCGLRINEDLTKGESSKADGYNNEPLHWCVDQSSSTTKPSSLFEIGLVEVYGLVRQIDGHPV